MPDELDPIRTAAKGLLYPSETDAPFEVLRFPAPGGGSLTKGDVAHLLGKSKSEAVEEQSLDEFFAELDGADDAERFRNLRRAIEGVLPDARVYRVGSVNIDVLVIGHTSSGELAGV